MNTAFGIGDGNTNSVKHFLWEINLCTFDHINDENCFIPSKKKIKKPLNQRRLFHTFSSPTIIQCLL